MTVIFMVITVNDISANTTLHTICILVSMPQEMSLYYFRDAIPTDFIGGSVFWTLNVTSRLPGGNSRLSLLTDSR